MCGISLIVSGPPIEGHCFSANAPGHAACGSSCQPACKVAETSHPNIEDICVLLKRRGPDHLGGAILYVGPLEQHIETWEYTPLESAMTGVSRNVYRSVCDGRNDDIEGVKERSTCNMSRKSAEGSNRPVSGFHYGPTLQFVGATLQLRGDLPVIQPLADSLGNVLVYNGEVFGGLKVRESENDSAVLMEALLSCCACACHSSRQISECHCPDSELHQTIPELLSSLRGPWALIYWQAVSRTLWFGRDAMGRRSLLVHPPSIEDPRLLLTSVAVDVRKGSGDILKYWEELVPGIYSITYSAHLEIEGGWSRAHSWQDPWLRSLMTWKRNHVSPSNISAIKDSLSECSKLSASKKSHNLPKFGNGNPKDTCDECAQAIKRQENQEQRVEGEETGVERVLSALHEAVKRRTINIKRQPMCAKYVGFTGKESSSTRREHTPVAVLFSGGLDSMILAALAHQYVDSDCSIDLLNVSFDGESAPDRITAIAGIAELREVFPSRSWRLFEIDAKLSECTNYRGHVQLLICPSNTYMDLNIGTALWLAASGKGRVSAPPSLDVARDAGEADLAIECSRQEPDLCQNPGCQEAHHSRSEARVLLVGSGADEQCGGYARYRTKFRVGGWEALEEEMRLDFIRIWKRNLGRDDRCMSDQGKEARFPFLDEDVVSTLLSLPLWDVVDLQESAGIGDKKILRQVAAVLGLKGAASLPKRAIQFGSRIARESNRKDFGSNRAANQASAGSVLLKGTK